MPSGHTNNEQRTTAEFEGEYEGEGELRRLPT